MPIADAIDARATEVKTRAIGQKSESTWKQKVNEKKNNARWHMGRLTRSVKERGKRFYRRHYAMIISFLVVLAYVAAMLTFFVVYAWLMTVNPWLGLVWLFIFIWLLVWWAIEDDQRRARRQAQRINNIRFQ